MNYLRTLALLTLMNLRSVPTRVGASIVIIVGIGGVVAVLVSLLAMAEGFEATLKDSGRDDRALILRSGSTSEINGNIPLDRYPILSEAIEIESLAETKLMAMETFIIVKLLGKHSGETKSITMRGVQTSSFDVRNETVIVKGRKPVQGKFELLAGVAANNEIRGLEIGGSIKIKGQRWLVVGHFSTDGSVYESELWVPERLLANLHNRGETFSSLLTTLKSADDFEMFRHRLENDRRLEVSVQRESTYFAKQSEGTSSLIKGIGTLLASIMSVGAVFAAFNTMHAAVISRRREIATLRALGFHRIPIVLTILTESMVLALIGGLLGAAWVYLVLNGYAVSTVNGTYSQVSFQFMVTPLLLIEGLQIALVLGLFGGAMPAIAAAKVSIVGGLRA